MGSSGCGGLIYEALLQMRSSDGWMGRREWWRGGDEDEQKVARV